MGFRWMCQASFCFHRMSDPVCSLSRTEPLRPVPSLDKLFAEVYAVAAPQRLQRYRDRIIFGPALQKPALGLKRLERALVSPAALENCDGSREPC